MCLHKHKFIKIEKNVTKVSKVLRQVPVYSLDSLTSPTNLRKENLALTLNIFSDRVRPICLPEVGQQFNGSDYCITAGWGQTQCKPFTNTV